MRDVCTKACFTMSQPHQPRQGPVPQRSVMGRCDGSSFLLQLPALRRGPDQCILAAAHVEI